MPIFLANAFLFSALVAVVPIMLHLLHRKRPQPIAFAAIRFLTEAIAKSRRSRRVTQCITLLMRVLIILLLALAFSQPVIKYGGLTLGRERTLVIVLDTTASMQAIKGDQTLFSIGRDWADKLIKSLDTGDKVALIAIGSPNELIVYPPVSDHARVRAALQELRPAFGHAEICSTLSRILYKNEAALHGMELHIFSDFQKSNWTTYEAKQLTEKLVDAGAFVYVNNCGSITSGDTGIMDVSFVPPAIIDTNSVTARAHIQANNQFTGSNVLHIENDGTEINHAAVELTPGGRATATLNADTTSSNQQMCGLLRCEDDAYPLNNAFYYSLQRVQGIPVAIVNGTAPRDSFFLKHALNPGRRASLLEPFDVDWSTFVATEIGTAAMAFICNPPPLDDAAVSRIEAMLTAGKDILLFPGNANGLSEETLRKIKSFARIQVRRSDNPEASRLQIRQGNSNNTFTKRISEMLPPPWSFPSRSNLEITMPSGSCDNLLETDKGSFIISAKQDAGTIWLFAISANRDWSDWPVTPSFLVCIQEIARSVAHRPGSELFTRIGGELALLWPENAHGNTIDMTITAPDKSTRRVSLPRTSPAKPLIIDGFTMPGIHSISDGQRTLRFAVNIPSEETILEYHGRQELMDSLRGAEAAYSTQHEELLDNINRARRGSPLWPLLLCMAFFLSILEVLFANMRSRAVALPHAIGELIGSRSENASTGGNAK